MSENNRKSTLKFCAVQPINALYRSIRGKRADWQADYGRNQEPNETSTAGRRHPAQARA
jgi:hypothetical protein